MLTATIKTIRVIITHINERGENKSVMAPIAYGPDGEILHIWAQPPDGRSPVSGDKTVVINGITYKLEFE